MSKADELIALLSLKHSSDVFISECKTGPSGEGCLRLDAWAMNKSWANASVFGYEVKVSRADFLSDNKWTGYLAYCNYFSFVCPRGVIDKEELPDNCGLIWTSKNNSRLYTKRKAAYREVDIPEELFRYILMNRVKVERQSFYTNHNEREEWEQWLALKEEDREFSWILRGKLRAKYDADVVAVRDENKKLSKEISAAKEIREYLEGEGIEVGERLSAFSVTQQLRRIKQFIPIRLINDMKNLETRLSQTIESIEEAKEDAND